jgi:hypothetical protein
VRVADGRDEESRIVGVLIRVADRGLPIPLRIDPMIQQGKKPTGTGAVGTGRFGYAVALPADGATALIGAWRDDQPRSRDSDDDLGLQA